MLHTMILGCGGLVFAPAGAWLVRHQQRQHEATRAGWGIIAIGLGRIIRAAGELTGRQPLGDILTICDAVFFLGGIMLLVSDPNTFRSIRGSRKRRRKLPPLRP